MLRVAALTASIQHKLEALEKAIRQEIKNKVVQIGREELKLFLFSETNTQKPY